MTKVSISSMVSPVSMLFLINGDEDGINKNDRTEPEQLAVEKAKAYHGWNHY